MSAGKTAAKVVAVAVVEDHAALRARLKNLLDHREGFRCVGVYGSGEEALRHIPRAEPDVVLMDLNLPGMSGVEAIAQLKTQLPAANVLVLTVYDDGDNIFNALKAGACGYLLKRSSTEEILAAIREVAAGGAPMSGQIARQVVAAFQNQPPPVQVGEGLSERERQILDLLCQGHANKEIAAQIFISVDTVRFHLKKIYEKLHVHSRTEAMAKHLRQARSV